MGCEPLEWPKDLTDRFSEDLDAGEARRLLDETARRAVARASCRAELLAAAYATPFTPLEDAMHGMGLRERLLRTVNEGPVLDAHVRALVDFAHSHAEAICFRFRGERIPYNDRSATED
jgi:hypothetical protein